MHSNSTRESMQKKGNENEIALTYFFDSAVWFHFDALFSILFLILLVFGVIVLLPLSACVFALFFV
jgi:hypothetical protein